MPKSYVVIEVTHKGPLPHLGGDVANRAHSMQGVDLAEVVGAFTENPVKPAAPVTQADPVEAAAPYGWFA